MSILYGNAVVGQSGGPTAAINATLAGVIRGYLDRDSHGGAIGTLYGMRNGVEGLLREDLVDLGIAVTALVDQSLFYVFGVFLDVFYVQHFEFNPFDLYLYKI